MIKRIKFTKMVASGNDFVVAESLPKGVSLKKLAREICDRKFGIGADGLLILNKAGLNAIRMRIFNSDGSEAQMCGNGARCAALFHNRRKGKIFTKAGVINTEVYSNKVKIQLTAPRQIKLDLPLSVGGRSIRVNFINTGVPHAVIFVDGISDIDVAYLGRIIRYHKKFAPQGANVNFVQVEGGNLIRIRTYERGVEGETLACGTGSTAAAIIYAFKNNLDNLVKVLTQSGEILKIYFQNKKTGFENVWLEGSAKIVYKGEYHV